MAQVNVKESVKKFGRHGSLIGIVSEPSRPADGPAVVILNAGIIHKAGPSRFSVGLARRLAGAGSRVLRFDLSGIGDSEMSTEEGTLVEIVQRDIADAIALMDDGRGVVLAGLCSGADNAFYVAADDERVVGLVLIDPTIHRTPGYYRRRNLQRLKSPRSWWNVLSGRSLYLRWRARRAAPPLPPGYYGLLTCDREEALGRARKMRERRVKFLYIVTGGASEYCNHPDQILESLPDAFHPDDLCVEWRPEMGHTLDRLGDRSWCEERIERFVAAFGATPAAVRVASNGC